MASLFTSEQLPVTSEQAIRIFDERYLAGISAAVPPSWISLFGDVIDVGAPRVTFPIGLLSTKYVETREESGKFKTMQETSFDLKVVEFDAGYEAKMLDLSTNVYAYKKWAEVPSRFLLAQQRHLNRNIVTLLEDATQTSPWDSVAYFSATHKATPSGDNTTTWSNYQSVAKDVTDISLLTAEISAMQDTRDENGDKIGIDPDTILVPTGKYQPLVVRLAQALILGSGTATAPTSNPYLGKFNIIHIPELTSAVDWYLVDSKAIASQGIPLWVAATFRPPSDLGLRTFDESSDYFKNTGKIKVSSHLWNGFKLVFPQAIRKVTGA